MPPNFGDTAVPHMMTFQSVLSTIAKTYRPSDEALKDSWENARFMRNDVGIKECLESRQRLTALLDWQIVPEDDESQDQKALADELTKLIARIPRFVEYRFNLQHAIWYGRYAIQHRYRYQNVNGKMRILPSDELDDPGWLPIHGDKLVFRWDDGSGRYPPHQLGIRVARHHGMAGDRLSDFVLEEAKTDGGWGIMPSDISLAYFLSPWQRQSIILHKHTIEDGDFRDPLDAGRIHGVGIRSSIYWEWFQKQNATAQMMEYLDRSAGGVEIWRYPASNPNALAQCKTSAKERMAGRNIIFFPVYGGEDAVNHGVEFIVPDMGGITALKELIADYFGHRIKRYILGQTLTSEADATGMGSGLAELHKDTLMQIVQYDVANHDETITNQLLRTMQVWNFPESRHIRLRFQSTIEREDTQAKLEAAQVAWQMGAEVVQSRVLELAELPQPRPSDRLLPSPSGGGAMTGQAGPSGSMSSGTNSPVPRLTAAINQQRRTQVAVRRNLGTQT